MVINCPICGEENPDDAEECKACGSPLKEKIHPERKEIKSGKILLATFAVIIIIIVAIIAAPIIYKSTQNERHSQDRDGDGMPDEWEEENGLNPDDPTDANNDPDTDGLTNREEFNLNTDPQNPDTDSDGVEDGLDLIPRHDAGIKVTIDTLRINDPVDFGNVNNPGEIFFRIYIDDKYLGEMPATGPEELGIDKEHDVNWSIESNVSDDRSYRVRIEMYDKDIIGEELLDINENNPSKDDAGYYLELNYYLGNEIGRKQTGESDGSKDGGAVLQKDGMIEYTITTIDVFA